MRSSKIKKATIYESRVKPIFDKILAFWGLVILSPLFIAVSAAIVLDNPGPIFFTQKRIGKDGRIFKLHKFRSMRTDAPHDVPTHQLDDPEKYITNVGRVLRRTSLDELPQIWDIFRGKMSVVGPRPALWNQDDLVAEREKYNANNVLPGLTGLAQIKGRDELEIVEKAKLDGEYANVLKQGGVKALFFDVKCMIETIFSVPGGKGVVEGGTGKLHKGEEMMSNAHAADAGFDDYGHRKHFHINICEKCKRTVLITGRDSYIGTSFEKWAKEHYFLNFTIDTVDMRSEDWRKIDFALYDTVFHVAGLAHADVGKLPEEEKKKYYAVNTDLAVEAAKKAKAEGVKQFVLMSSMIIYGDSASYGKEKVIDEYTVPVPTNFYGDSKWRADKKVRALADGKFRVAVVRPPMVYGKESKGNYQTLVKLAKKLPVFPNVDNRRSMLYIDSLCELLCKLMISGEGGVYFPQDKEYKNTSKMVKQIADAVGKRIWVTKLLKPAVAVCSYIPGKVSRLVDKAFGNFVYSKGLSEYDGLDYQVDPLESDNKKTEGTGKTVLILVNHDVVLYNFRLELVERLLRDGYDVHISSPYGVRIKDLVALGAKYHEVMIDRHGMNPLKELSILQNYKRVIRQVNPIIILGYTIKPNIYGAIAARDAGVPFVANITGLGTAVGYNGPRQHIAVLLYKLAFTKVQRVFFQNKDNKDFFQKKHIAVDKLTLLPGSGVNLNRYPITPYPNCGDGKSGEPVKFAFISRIMEEKGINQYLEAAEKIKKEYPMTEFHVCGFCEKEYDGRLEELNEKGVVMYHGMIRDVAKFMSEMHCIVHPTYYPEGLCNVLLEAASCGRCIITTDRAGCREVVKNKINGFLVPEKDVRALIQAIGQFIELDNEKKVCMGMEGRKLVEKSYDRQIVVKMYMKEISRVGK